MASVKTELFKRRKQGHLRMGGCPVSVAEQVLALVELGGTKNPYFDPREIVGFNRAYLTWRSVVAFKRLHGHEYQRGGPCDRGDAAPEVQPLAHPNGAAE